MIDTTGRTKRTSRASQRRLEHGWLRLAMGQHGVWERDSDFAETLTPDELKRMTLLNLRVTRSALMCLTMAVKFHEDTRQRDPCAIAPIPQDWRH